MEYGSVIYTEFPNKTLQKLAVVQNNALRTILGARKTSPISSLEVEAYIPPIEIRFKFLFMKWYLKQMYSPPDVNLPEIGHETGSLPNTADNKSYFSTKARNILGLLGMHPIKRSPTTYLSPIDPTVNIEVNVNTETFDNERILSKYTSINTIFQNFIKEKYPNHIEIYTDGSKLTNGSTAAAVYVPSLHATTTWLLNPLHSVLGSELFAIQKALQLVTTDRRFKLAKAVIMTDSKSSLHIIRNTRNPNYRAVAFQIQALLLQLQDRVKLQWVRGHAGIIGNEVADKAANLGHHNNFSAMSTLSSLEVLKLIKEKFFNYWTKVWKNRVTLSQKGRFLSDIMKEPKFRPWLGMKSRILETVTARLRIGHVGVSNHMNRFEMSDTNLCTICLTPDTVSHYLLHCKRFGNMRYLLQDKLNQLKVPLNLVNLLGGGDYQDKIQRKIHLSLVHFVQETGRLYEL